MTPQDYESEQRRLLLQEIANAGHDRVDGYRRHDLRQDAKKFTQASTTIGINTALEEMRLNTETPVNPIILGGATATTEQNYTALLPFGSGGSPVPYDATAWFNGSDHTQKFSKNALIDGSQIFGLINYGAAGFTSGNGTDSFYATMDLVDQNNNPIAGAPSYRSDWTVTISAYVSPASYTRTVTLTVTASSGQVTNGFNGIRLKTNSALSFFTSYQVQWILYWFNGGLIIFNA